MPLVRENTVKRVTIYLNDDGTFKCAERDIQRRIIDDSDGSVEAERFVIDPITKAQLKTFVAGL